jgi:hypothetical protein
LRQQFFKGRNCAGSEVALCGFEEIQETINGMRHGESVGFGRGGP